MSANARDIKVVILGPQGVGKTSLAMRYTGKPFNSNVGPTIGSSYFPHKVIIKDIVLHLEIWDTAGQERFRSMAPLYYRNAKAALVVYDLTCYESFLALKIWVRELLRNIDDQIIICIVGNKQDLYEERKVNTTEAESYAMSISADYFETSALSHCGINEVFNCIANKVTRLVDNPCQSFSFGDSVGSSGHLPDSLNPNNKIDLSPNPKKTKDDNSKCCTN